MYRKDNPHQMKFENFYLPFGGKLRSDNRWVILSKQIPWEQIEQGYARHFESSYTGTVAEPVSLALGALIIKERMGLTDRETVLQIQENPYSQYFLGFPEYSDESPFDPSLMVTFRKRFDKESLAKLAETSEAVIMVSFIVMNLERILSEILLFVRIMCWSLLKALWPVRYPVKIVKSEVLASCKIRAAVAC